MRIVSWLAASSLLLSVGQAEAAYIAADNAADPAYTNGWYSGCNGGVGFGAWRFDHDPSQYFIASAPGIDVSNQSWAITAEYGTRAIRPFTGGPLGVGQIVQIAWQFPGTNGNDSEIQLLDTNDNPIVALRWDRVPIWLGVATNGSWGTAVGASPPWAVPGASVQLSFTLTSSNTLNLLILSGGNLVSFPVVAFTGDISEIGLFVDGPDDPTLPDKTACFNSLSVSAGGNLVAQPIFSPWGGPLKNGQLVTLSTTTPGASIRYRTDGGIPTATTGILYTNPVPFSFTAPTTVNAIAYAAGMEDSPVTSATFDPPPSMWIGNNLGAVNDWSTSWPFVDVIKRMRGWQTCSGDSASGWPGPWDTGFEAFIPLDTNGWPTQVPFDANGTNQWVHTILSTLNQPGTYQFIYEGTGRLNVSFPGPGNSVSLTATGGVQTYTFTTPSSGVALLEISRSDTNDYLRNFHLVLTNYLATYQTQPFDPLFLERLRPFRCLRFIDWGNVDGLNGPTVASWTNRPTPNYYTQAGQGGVALEYMAQLCNTLQADAWFNVPHMADDDYVRQAAIFWRDHLDPNLRLYVEYSNETWNWDYLQTSYVQTQGVNLNLDPDPATAGQKYVALRSAQIWNIFQQVFGSAASSRLVKVLATQSSSTGITDMRIAGLLDTNINVTGTLPDVLAIAPYFGNAFTPSDLPPNAPYPTVDDVVTTLSEQSIADQQVQVVAQKQIADANGWRLVCYEGGQGFVGIWGAENDTNLTAILEAANRDPRMFDRYTEYINMLQAQGVGLVNNFDYCEGWSQWGSWGSLEYQDQPTNQAPKYAALIDWITTAGPPRLLQQPASQTLPLGADLTLSVTAVGASPMSYQWQLNDSPLPGATNSTLILSNVQTSDTGNYSVLLVNPPGSLSSAEAAVTVLPLTIIQQPQEQTVNPGSNATFTINVTDPGPVSYQWLFNGAPLPGATSAELVLTNVSLTQAGTYAAAITDPAGTVTSDPATLTVNLPVTIMQQPLGQAADVGSNATFSVEATGSGPLSYQWLFDGTNLAGATDPVLVLTNVQAINAGNYSVIISNMVGSVVSSNAMLLVGFLGDFTQADIGTPSHAGWVTITSDAGGEPLLTINGGGNDIWNTGDNFHYYYTSRTGDFDCAVRVRSFTGPDTWSKVELMARESSAGGARFFANMATQASGQNGVQVQWRDTTDGQANWPGWPVPMIQPNYPDCWLRLQRVGSVFNAFYSYDGTNWNRYYTWDTAALSAGPFASTVLVGVAVTALNDADANGATAVFSDLQFDPMIISPPEDLTVLAGNEATLSVSASGASTLSYQWWFDSMALPGATNATLILTNAQTAQAGTYRVIVSDAVGSVTSTQAVLTVNAPPALDVQPQSQQVIAGNPVTFCASVSGSIPLSCQWQFNGADLSDGGQIAGSQSNCLTLTNVMATDAGDYQLLVTNAYGWTTSVVARLDVSPAAPVLAWTNPAPVTYGAALGPMQLDATASVPGTFAYSPAVGTVLDAGTNLLSVTFAPDDPADYKTVSATVSLIVQKAAPTLTWADPASIVYGTALGPAQLLRLA